MTHITTITETKIDQHDLFMDQVEKIESKLYGIIESGDITPLIDDFLTEVGETAIVAELFLAILNGKEFHYKPTKEDTETASAIFEKKADEMLKEANNY